MSFENENTWFKASAQGNGSEFHIRYEKALEKAQSELGRQYPIVIGGREMSTSRRFADRSPADTRIVLGYFPKAGREEVRVAIAEAKRAFGAWRRLDWRERVKIFRRAADRMAELKFELAAWLTLENGKNRFEAIADVDEAIDFMRYYALQVELHNGFEKPMGKAFPNEETKSALKPYGVWAVISPFNFPAALSVGMLTGALITGNSVVFKPSSDTPLVGFKLYEIMRDAGLPDGVLNYVVGSGEELGEEITGNRDVSGVAFTGSAATGTWIMRRLISVHPRPFIAEMGGKNPAVVTGKANLNKAVEGILKSAFGYSGQKCSATSVLFIERSVKEAFLERLVAGARKLKVGDPRSRETFLGPVINERALENYKRYVEVASTDGRILTGGRVLVEGDLKFGYYVEPTVVDSLPADHRFFAEELFLPILVVSTFESLGEAVAAANRAPYGLTAGIFSEDEGEVAYFFENIEAGVVYANRRAGATTGAMVGAQPFGGWKLSGSSGKGTGSLYYLPQFMREQAQTRVME